MSDNQNNQPHRTTLRQIANEAFSHPFDDGQTTELPPGYRVLNDGPGREVLMREEWEECPVFIARAEAAAWAWTQHEDFSDG